MTGKPQPDPLVHLLETTMKTDVPAEAESRMRTHLDSLRQRLEAPQAAPDHQPPHGTASRRVRSGAALAAGIAVVLAAAAPLLWMVGAGLFPGGAVGVAAAGEFVLVPEGGRLDALDDKGQLLGPCPLKHTDVDVQVSGHFTRVNVAQRYHNPYEHKIEAVYTFPLSHRGAVDRMTMTVGDRVVQGEVKQREQARRIYEAARRQGHVAALLEQERPNIFTQSVANIEPGAEVLIEISYVEVLESVDGRYQFDFPMVVAPRYTPGTPLSPGDALPKGLKLHPGVVLLGPAEIDSEMAAGLSAGMSDGWLRQHATAIDRDSPIIDVDRRRNEPPRAAFHVKYAEGAVEPGELFADGVGHVGGRWFFCPPRVLPKPGEPFAVDTDQVPDASRVTPMPVKPDQRAGHDISVRVTIDTGGPGIVEVASSSHEIVRKNASASREDGKPQRSVVSLQAGRDIPNRDFRLAWRLTSEKIEEATFTHTGRYGDFEGGFFTLILQPPDRIPDDEVRPRELIFVLDQSGSMTGARLADRSALDAAKDIIHQAIDTMREGDRFNIISFSGGNDVLWDQPQPNTPENHRRAQAYVDQRRGGGGTEMRGAVLKALEAGPVARPRRDDVADAASIPADAGSVGHDHDRAPMRIVLFVTDGLVSNDAAIIEAIRQHAHETRVFTVGMSHAPNRHLLDEMARVGRGAVDYVLPEDQVEPIVKRFADRIATPVLTDIELSFEGIEVADVLPSPEQMPDLFDVQPLVIHGRYTEPGTGKLTIRGRTGSGRYERSLDLELPKVQPRHDTIATLWARQKVGELMRAGENQETIEEIVRLGETFQIVTQHTSFVAVERRRVTIGGQPVLVRVPIEFPKGMSWEGIFGEEVDDDQLLEHHIDLVRRELASAVHGRADAEDTGEGQSGEMTLKEARLDGKEVFESRPQDRLRRSPRSVTLNQQAVDARLGMELSEAEVLGEAGGRVRGPVPDGERHERIADMARHRIVQERPVESAIRAPESGDGVSDELQKFEVFGSSEPSESYRRPLSVTRTEPGRVAQRVTELSEGIGVVRVALRGGNSGDVAKRLRDLLGGDDALGRVLQPQKSDDLYLLVHAAAAEIIQPFAEKLADEKLSDEARQAALDELVEALTRQLPAVRRDLELRRRLAPSLYEQVTALRDGPRRDDRPDAVRITVLLRDLNADTLAALRQAGFEREATADTASFVVGRIGPPRLEALALLDGVRRIEPVR